jgi:hypothetical protein
MHTAEPRHRCNSHTTPHNTLSAAMATPKQLIDQPRLAPHELLLAETTSLLPGLVLGL